MAGRPPAKLATIPAPTGGWNARDPLPAMKPTDAVALINAIPGTGGVTVRGGTFNYASGIGGQVNALLSYRGPAISKLFACSGGSIYDVTTQGPVGAAVVTGNTGDAWSGVQFGTPGGSYLMAANGTDPPQKFDGSTWSAIALVSPQPATYSGVNYSYPYTVNPSKLMGPVVFGQRVWFVEKGSLRVWFLPINAIGSSAQNPPATGSAVPDVSPCCLALDLSSRCRLGGSLVAMAVWTTDGPVGPSAYAVFITSAGEVLIYQGTDPTLAASWSIVGVVRTSPPIGAACIMPAGADVAILTQTGVLPLSAIVQLVESQDETVAITDKVRGAFQGAYALVGQASGWAMAEYPKGGLLVVNVPNGDGTYRQFVQNQVTGAWCSFSGLPAVCWGRLGDGLFFGTPDGRVVQYDVGTSDVGGIPITATILPAYGKLNTAARKRLMLARPIFTGALGYVPPIQGKVDYDPTLPALPQPSIPRLGSAWGSAWGAPWQPPTGTSTNWRAVQGIGTVVSVLLSIATLNTFVLNQIDITYEIGGAL